MLEARNSSSTKNNNNIETKHKEEKKKKKMKKKKKLTKKENNNESVGVKIKYEISGGGEIVNRVIERMNKELDVLKNGSNNPIMSLNLNILQCTEGSRWGRMCCAEVGVGWIVLEIKWELIDENKGCVLVKGASKLRDSAAIGFADLCESNYGEENLLNTMTPNLATEIKSKSRAFL